MSDGFHYIEVRVRYLLPEEGGRRTGVFSGYRGQFYYKGEDCDGFQFFPGRPNEMVPLGTTVRAFVQFRRERWNEVHSKRVELGMPFEIREGRRTVGRGTVTRIDVDDTELDVEVE